MRRRGSPRGAVLNGLDASEWIPIVGAALAALLAAVVCWGARRVDGRGLRIALRAVTGFLSLLALLIGGALLFFDLNYTRHLAPLISPDGRHIATTSYIVGTGTGSDMAEVAVRGAWNPYAHRVYTGPSQYEPNAATPEPEVHWLDNTHLEIRFHTYVSASQRANSPSTTGAAAGQGCAASAVGIAITCVDTRVHAVR